MSVTFNIYRSDAPMDLDAMPEPIAIGLTDKNYSDASAVHGNSYYYRVGAVRDGVERIGGEIECLAAILWQPDALNLSIWIDFADESTVTKDSSNLVSAVLDKSGKNRHAYQNDTTKQPIYNDVLKCISSTSSKSVDLVGDFVNIPDETINQYTIFMVVKPNKTSTTTPSQTGSGVGFWNNRNQVSTFFQTTPHLYGTNSAVSPILSATTNAIHLSEQRDSYAPMNVSVGHSIGSQKMLVSIERQTNRQIRSGIFGAYTSGATTSITKGLGWNKYHLLYEYSSLARSEGDLYEVILIHNVLSVSDLQKVEGYLAHKWAIANLLPSDHPYKINPPVI